VTYYTGIQGDVTIDANGDREFNYMMKQIHDSSNQSQVRYCSLYKRNQWKPCSAILNYICQMSHGFSTQVIANYFGTYKEVKGVHISWPGGRTTPPKDSPDCGFQGELCINLGIKKPRLIAEKKCVCVSESLLRALTTTYIK